MKVALASLGKNPKSGNIYDACEGRKSTAYGFAWRLRQDEGEDDDEVCDVCGRAQWQVGNEMLLCDGCDRGFHQRCYHVTVIPEDDWFCRVCIRRRGGVTRQEGVCSKNAACTRKVNANGLHPGMCRLPRDGDDAAAHLFASRLRS